MKKSVLLYLVAALALAVFVAACGQPSPGGNTAMNHNSMDHSSMNHNSMDHSQMNHNSMDHNSMPMNSNGMHRMDMKSDPDAASAPYDLQFLDTMTAHHEDAVMMSETALQRTQNEELKKFAQKIIDDQKRENEQIKRWREQWFAGRPRAVNMEMPGMMESMKPMDADHLKKMDAMTGREFDIHFLEMMIPHHEGALKMAKDALTKAERAEIKTLANEIIKEQEAEIKQMTDWKAQWSK